MVDQCLKVIRSQLYLDSVRVQHWRAMKFKMLEDWEQVPKMYKVTLDTDSSNSTAGKMTVFFVLGQKGREALEEVRPLGGPFWQHLC